MCGTKMVRVGNFDALEPIKYHRSSRPIRRRADEEPGRSLGVRVSQGAMRLGQQKMLEGPEDGEGNVRGTLALLCSRGWSWVGAVMGETTSGHRTWLCTLSWVAVPASVSAAPAGAVAWLCCGCCASILVAICLGGS